MKSAKHFSFMVFVLLMFVASQFGMTASSRLVTETQAIIVIRHGDDAKGAWPAPSSEYWKSISPNWPKYDAIPNQRIPGQGSLPEYHNSVTVDKYVGHGLTPLKGELQAERLQKLFSEILKDAGERQFGPYAKVTRAITIDPSPTGATPNPFDTFYPFLKNDLNFTQLNTLAKPNLLLINTSNKTTIVADGLQAMIKNNTVLPADGGSTLLCWDREGLWGSKQRTDDSYELDESSILYQLAGSVMGPRMGVQLFYKNFYCDKGAVIYIFTPTKDAAVEGTTRKYNMTIYSSSTPLDSNGLGTFKWMGSWDSNGGITTSDAITPGPDANGIYQMPHQP